jgi:hypothetical protein
MRRLARHIRHIGIPMKLVLGFEFPHGLLHTQAVSPPTSGCSSILSKE